jgi:uncharacterized membrane protein (DUF485 family)
MATADGAARADTAGAQGAAGSDQPRIDWVAAEKSPEFRELIKRKRRFVVPATIFFMAWYFGFIILAGYAPDFMGEEIVNGLTVGYVFALSQFVMVWVLAKWYLNKADKEFDPLADKAAKVALEAGRRDDGRGSGGTRRFDPDATAPQSDGAPAPTAEVRR